MDICYNVARVATIGSDEKEGSVIDGRRVEKKTSSLAVNVAAIVGDELESVVTGDGFNLCLTYEEKKRCCCFAAIDSDDDVRISEMNGEEHKLAVNDNGNGEEYVVFVGCSQDIEELEFKSKQGRIDLSKPLLYEVLVERNGFSFFVSVDYEKIPSYCAFCKTIGHEEGSCKKKQQKEVNVNEPSKDAANNKKTHYVPKKTIPTTTGVTNGDAVGSPPSIPPVALEFTTGFVEVTQPNSKESLPAFGNDVDKSVTMPCNNETLSRMNVLNGVVVDTPPDNNVDNSEIPLSHQHEDNEDDVVSVGTLEDEKGCDPPFEAVLTKSQKKRAREKAKKAVMAESQSKSWNMRPRSDDFLRNKFG
ncbi:uncharacterized protein LOC113360004 [Papaver somniferum]|uniref:uncharacterized protein LOC113360004 n=1 Tax=Papaver somniferum TaxID=3469 RepID=UPI000E6F8AF1|nr:uncharacterized protein LOC113360004 [Papaver somniferum]